MSEKKSNVEKKEKISDLRTKKHILTKKERKVARIRGFILNAAEKLFTKKGFNKTSMKEIADLAVLSRATLYNYFKTKEEIYFELGILRLDEIANDYKKFSTKKSSGFQQIEFLSRGLLKLMLESPFYSRLLSRFFRRSKDLKIPIEDIYYTELILNKESEIEVLIKKRYNVFRKLLEKYIEYRRIWQEAIKKGINDGSIKTKLNINHLNFMIIFIIQGVAEQIDYRRKLLEHVDLSIDQITNITFKIILKLIGREI